MSKKQKTKRIITLTMLVNGVCGISDINGNIDMGDSKYSAESIRGEMRPLNCGPAGVSDGIGYYFELYGLDAEKYVDGVVHSFGTFESEGFTIAAHVYVPEYAKGTVVIMHGYLNHCGQLKYVIRHLLENGYSVCAYDMPGHGLSTGKDAWMDNFDRYVQVLQDFKPIVAERCPGPYHVTAFSQGACPVIQTMLERKEDFFEKTILVAPLVRPVGWRHAQITYRLYWPFRDSVPRLTRKNTSDKEFLDFNKAKDFLHKRRVPLIWVRALEKWNGKVRSMDATGKKMLVIQGDKDSTVDWKYNTKFLAGKFDTKEVVLKNARHELFNEEEEIKGRVFAEMIGYLGDEREGI